MSASLVGSEMCIRDSMCRFGMTAPDQVQGANLPIPPTRVRTSGLARCPVSYTHLTLPTICSV
eukprot:4098867-Alexandrium_andersonii.AAC.1